MIAVGTILHDTYRVEEQIGHGAMGVVFRVSHLRVPRAFAVKVLQPNIRDVDTSFARFKREAEISSRLGHPNIVEVFDFNHTAEGQAYFVMELLSGHDLATELRRQPLPTPARVLELLQPVASALTAAHAAGVIHRDLKPSNIFLSRRGESEVVKVLDFGVSKILGSQDVATQSESLLGTPAYMSPEQASGHSKHVDARSDQFSLAAIAYELLGGRRPFGVRGESPFMTLYAILNQAPLPLANVPPTIGPVVMRALAKAPEERFPDVGAFVAALELAIGGAAVASTASSAGAPRWPESPSSETSAVMTRTLTEAAPLLPDAPAPPMVAPAMPSVAEPSPSTASASGRRSRMGVVAAVAAAGAVAAMLTLHRPATRQAPVAPASATPPPPALPMPPPIAPRSPSFTTVALAIVPMNARVRMVDFDGATRTLAGPWAPTKPNQRPAQTLRWRDGERPQSVRVEADGFEPSDVALPPDGSDVTLRVTLTRKHAASGEPRHHDLSYPWQSR